MDKKALATLAAASAAAGFAYLYRRERRQPDVFLNFSGQDTRYDFTAFLYMQLAAKFSVFKDDCELVGEQIGPGLSRAIENCKVAICIISKTYGGRKWCLTELSMIMRRHAKQGLLVLPIFYEVDVSHVRDQSGEFGQAFSELANRHPSEKVEEWKEALRSAAKIRGWTSQQVANGRLGVLVKRVVEKVSSILSPLWIERIPMFRKKGRASNCQVFLISSPAITKTFTSHLPYSLKRKKISVFRDDDPYLIGKDFDHEVRNAMHCCKIFILVISENFASSRDCLDKLVQIVQCSEKKGQKILPVFYEVDGLQNQKVWDRIRNDMMQHNVLQDTRQKWEDSLKWVCSIGGLPSENFYDGNEGGLAEAVLQEVIRLMRT